MSSLDELLAAGAKEGVFPQAQAVVLQAGQPVVQGLAGSTTSETVFDLASLTKILSTTSLFMAAWGEGKLGPETRVARFFPESASGKAGVTLSDLLFHSSGLPAFVPYFARVMPAVPELFDDKTPRKVWYEVRGELVNAIFTTGLRKTPGEEAVYSDVGFLQLGEILSKVYGASLDEIFQQRIARPLTLGLAFRRISSHPGKEGVAITGLRRPRDPAPGQKKVWEPFPQIERPNVADVDDDNAWVMDGVAGHAGVFGTAADVARFGQLVLEELEGAGRIAPAPLWKLALSRDGKTPNTTRAMGFDTPSATGSSAGQFLGNRTPGAVGHTGFTGTSLWIDLPRKLSVALVTNRVAFGRTNNKMVAFRPRFHDEVMKRLGLHQMPS
ncbi:MAG: serine hydrolase domain-containing protein [Myxococcaceae bacterium]